MIASVGSEREVIDYLWTASLLLPSSCGESTPAPIMKIICGNEDLHQSGSYNFRMNGGKN